MVDWGGVVLVFIVVLMGGRCGMGLGEVLGVGFVFDVETTVAMFSLVLV